MAVSTDLNVISELAEITYRFLYYLHLATLDEYSITRFTLEVLLSLNTAIVLALFLKQFYSNPFSNLEVRVSTEFDCPSACDRLNKGAHR